MSTRSKDSEEEAGIEEMAHNGFQDYLRIRRLENVCPLLKDYVNPDSRVLDLGCGPGTITADVAELASSGSIVGLDANAEALEVAREETSHRGLKNVEFQTGDGYSLPFEDDSFDLVYSNSVLEWTRDAVDVIREKKRVTKKGGSAIAMVTTLADLVLYPACPTVMRFLESCRQLREPGSPYFFNPTCGHEVAGFFVDAGFTEHRVDVYVPPLEMAYRGSRYFDYRYRTMISIWTKGSKERDEWLIESRLMESDFRERIAEEIEAWRTHPHAFTYQPRVAAIGKVVE